jgi:hypothetical protein
MAYLVTFIFNRYSEKLHFNSWADGTAALVVTVSLLPETT